jgi:hypothetical protein
MSQPVTAQPGGYDNKQMEMYSQQQPVAMQPGFGVMQQGGGAPALDYLAQLDKIEIHQILHLLEGTV